MTKKQSNTWICEKESTLISTPVIQILERQCRSSEDERKHKFYLLQSRDWSNIIPVTEDGKIIMVRQYRVGVSEHTLEIPGGVNDAEDSDPMASAIRELEEETGYVPTKGSRCEKLGWVYPNPAIMNNRCHFFVVGPVKREKEQKLDGGEMIEVVEVPIDEIPSRLERGEISHALTLNGFFALTRRSNRSSGTLVDELKTFCSI